MLSTVEDIIQFKSSAIWAEVLIVLESRRELLTNTLVESEGDISELRMMQGRIRELKDLEDLPDMLIAMAGEKIEEEKR